MFRTANTTSNREHIKTVSGLKPFAKITGVIVRIVHIVHKL